MLKNIKYHALALVAMVAVFMLTSCNKTPQYTKLINEDAVMLARIDVQKIGDQMGETNLKEFSQQLKKEAENGKVSTECLAKLEEITNDPAKLGIDLREPIIACVTPKGSDIEVRIVGAMHDRKALTETITACADKEDKANIATDDDYTTYSETDCAMVFDDESFCITIANKEKDALIEATKQSFTAKSDAPKANAAEIETLLNSKGVAQVMLTRKGAEWAYKQAEITLDKSLNPADVSVLLNLETTNGEAKMTYAVQTYSEAWDKYLAKQEDMCGNISSKLLGSINKESITMMCNINGKKVCDAIEESGVLNSVSKYSGHQVEVIKQFEKYISIINGDIAITANYEANSGIVPNGQIYVATTNNDIVTTMTQTLGQLVTAKGDSYQVAVPAEVGEAGLCVNFGYKDAMTYATFGKDLKPFAPSSKPIGNDPADKKFFFYCDYAFVKNIIKKFEIQKAEINDLIDILESTEIAVSDQKSGEIKVTFTDKTVSPIATLAKKAFELAKKESERRANSADIYTDSDLADVDTVAADSAF